MKKSRKAVSVVFTYKKEIFSIVRQNYLRAFPGYTAFPGGKVDRADKVDESLETTLLNTVKREMQEELKIDIEALKASGKIHSIRQFAKATSPSFNPYIYETYFYRIDLTEKLEFELDLNEARAGEWLDPSSLLRDYNFGKRLVIYPIKKVIESFNEDFGFQHFLGFDRDRNESIPMIEPMRNFIQIMPLSNTLPPAERTNAFVLGDEVKLIVDPSPKDIEEYRLVLEKIKNYKIEKVFITHHHGDHHQYASDLASYLNVPIMLSEDTYQRCLKVYGENYFGDNTIEFAKEGDVVGTWLKRKIIVLEVPGHDRGHLALASEKLEWCIVGDLFQGIGTVVVGGEEGDMLAYFKSLEKVIELSPKSVTPSHGITLGGTHIIEKTLEHRKQRERDIKRLHLDGLSMDDILDKLYFEIPKRLRPYAMANIKSHLKKLRKEKEI